MYLWKYPRCTRNLIEGLSADVTQLAAIVSSMKVAGFNLQLISIYHATSFIGIRDKHGLMAGRFDGNVMGESRAMYCIVMICGHGLCLVQVIAFN
jgi:hypothetical protein